MFFDPMYLVFAAPALLLALYGQARVKSNFNKYSKVGTRRGLTGAQVARYLLDAAGLSHVEVQMVKGNLSDHYDPRGKVLRLSEPVYSSTSVAAAGIAAHEMGHALQDKEEYAPLVLRSTMVPAVRIGSMLGPILFIIGFIFNFLQLAWVGLIFFAGAVVFSVVTLPVEFNASNRAKRLLVAQGLMMEDEMVGVTKVLNAAALTYVAAAAQAISTLLYYVFLLMGRRD
jgi:Zn-dependent membrane protease YugP